MSPAPDGTVTWRELLGDATEQLARSLPDSADREARWIVADCAGVAIPELAGSLGSHASERGVARLDDMVRRRVSGEPLQYVLGSWGFRTLDLMVDSRVLIPRPETESVVSAALAEVDRQGITSEPTRVVDLGTGSGAIALSIAVERVHTEVWATDTSAAALEVARANTVGIGRPGRRVRTVAGDWFEALPRHLLGRIDVMVSNPPYVPDAAELPDDVTRWEPVGALRSGPDGGDALRHLIGGAGEWLRDGGSLVCELSPEQGPAMAAVAAEHFHEVSILADLAGRDRTLVARRTRA